MYEEMTFETIMDQMMDDMPDGLDTSEGSLIYHACAKCAARLEEAYIELSQVADNQYPDTADLDHFVRFGQEKGIYIEEATAAEFEGKFNIAVEIGAEFSGDDYDYIITEQIDETTHTYRLECEETGSEPNAWLGELIAIDEVEGLETAELTKLLVEGKEEEDEESYRMRLLDSFEIKPFAGNRSYYIQEVGELDDVGGVKVYRRTGSNISIVIISAAYEKPSEKLITDVQTKVDPIQNSGQGIGIAPIGHAVTVSGVEELQIDITVNVEYDTGYTYEGLKTQIEEAVENYMLLLRKEWIDTDSIAVRRAGVENAIFDVEGIIDVAGITLNGQESNIMLNENVVPKKGEVVCS